MSSYLTIYGVPKNEGKPIDIVSFSRSHCIYSAICDEVNVAWAGESEVYTNLNTSHSDGELCFGGGWFIVMAYLPTGQVSNHYRIEDWNLFNIPERWKADEWDGHTPVEAANRLYRFCLHYNEYYPIWEC